MQKISKDGKVKCIAESDYSNDIIKSMRKAGYKVEQVKIKQKGK